MQLPYRDALKTASLHCIEIGSLGFAAPRYSMYFSPMKMLVLHKDRKFSISARPK